MPGGGCAAAAELCAAPQGREARREEWAGRATCSPHFRPRGAGRGQRRSLSAHAHGAARSRLLPGPGAAAGLCPPPSSLRPPAPGAGAGGRAAAGRGPRPACEAGQPPPRSGSVARLWLSALPCPTLPCPARRLLPPPPRARPAGPEGLRQP